MKALIRKRPLPTFFNAFDHFLNDDFFKAFDDRPTVWNGTQPAVNIEEDGGAFRIEMAAPGYDKSDFDIKVDDNVLSIASERKEVTNDGEGKNYKRREFKYAAFTRNFNLPDTVDSTKIEANYTNGILTISIPKKEEAKPIPARTIEIS